MRREENEEFDLVDQFKFIHIQLYRYKTATVPSEI